MNKSPKFSQKLSSNKVSDKSLILMNDDYNTFDHVVDCLESLCDHNALQAEQCALLTHYKGSCQVLVGGQAELELVRNDLVLYGLNVKIT